MLLPGGRAEPGVGGWFDSEPGTPSGPEPLRPRRFRRLFTADDLAVRLVLLTSFLRDGCVDLRDDLRTHPAGTGKGREQRLDALDVLFFETMRQFEIALALGKLAV